MDGPKAQVNNSAVLSKTSERVRDFSSLAVVERLSCALVLFVNASSIFGVISAGCS